MFFYVYPLIAIFFFFQDLHGKNRKNNKHSISVKVQKSLSFGTFYKSKPNGNGTVTVSKRGIRTKTGNINLVFSDPGHNASIKINSSSTDRINVAINFVTNPSNGANEIPLKIDQYPSYLNPIIGNNYINIGGTLSIRNSTPKGNYTKGSFIVILAHE